jgi:hypothetical protein
VADAAFAHQEADGGFAYNVARSGLSATPNATGLAAQAAFFVSDLSHTLLLLRDSPWFRASQMTPALRQRIPGLEQHLSSALGYLINHRQDLHADHDTANRFLIYAEAYYLSGKLLGRDDALSVGREFIDQALSQQASDGTFLELHGFDSSYQNVSLSEGEYLFLYMSGDSEQPRLWNAISRGYERELRALAPSGEISTAGNTRVGAQSIPALHGGPVHRFDSEAAGFAFTYFAAIAGTPDAERNADLVVHHYFNV